MRNRNGVTSKRIDPIDGMVNASLNGISVSEAEHALAIVWRCVEEHGAEPPRLRFSFQRDGSINIQFLFSNQAIATLVLNGLDVTNPEGIRLRRHQAGSHLM